MASPFRTRAINYTDTKIASICADAQLRLEQRKCSPITERMLLELTGACTACLKPQTTIEKKELIIQVMEIEHEMQNHQAFGLTSSNTLEEHEKKLLEWRKLVLFSVYGDYLRRICTILRKTFTLPDIQAPAELKACKYVSEISALLAAEKESWEAYSCYGKSTVSAKDVQTTVAVHNAILHLDLDKGMMIDSIHLYAKRNDLTHSGLSEFLERRDYVQIAKKTHADRKELLKVLPPSLDYERNILLLVLDTIINRWFGDSGLIDDPNQWEWSPTLMADAQKAWELVKGNKKPMKDENVARSLVPNVVEDVVEKIQVLREEARAQREAEEELRNTVTSPEGAT